MKKKILSLFLISSALNTFADVNLYGRVAVGVENDDVNNSTAPTGGSIQDMGSYFGLRGIDPVYGSTAAIWQVEQYLDITSGQIYYVTSGGGLITPYPGSSGISNGIVRQQINTLASSESYLGLQGDWGRVRLGNLSNYQRSDMGAIDTFNYNNGVDGLGLWSRAARILPTAFRYDSPTWGGFNFSGIYSFTSNSQFGLNPISPGTSQSGGFNGNYSGAIYGLGLTWSSDEFAIKLGTMVNQQVGLYDSSNGTTINPSSNITNNVQYSNAHISRLELSYNDPDGAIIGLGLQVADGWGWAGWANSGGSFNNFVYNPALPTPAGLNTAQYQTQEMGASFGWHIGPWTPKIAYVYGNNLMYNSDLWGIITGTGNQIANSGYQQAVAELDWNINPKTIVFINYGQIWYGSTLSNVSYSYSVGTTICQTPTFSGGAYNNQSSTAIGFTHTF